MFLLQRGRSFFQDSNSSFSLNRCPHSSDPFWVEAPKESISYTFTHMGNFLLLLLLIPLHTPPTIPVSRPNFQSQGPNPSCKTPIPAKRSRFGPQGWDLGLQSRVWDEARIWAFKLGLGSRYWDLGLETEIWALKLGFEEEGWRR